MHLDSVTVGPIDHIGLRVLSEEARSLGGQLSTDPASVEATTGRLRRCPAARHPLSTDPASVEARLVGYSAAPPRAIRSPPTPRRWKHDWSATALPRRAPSALHRPPASVEATTGRLQRCPAARHPLSTDPASVEATTGRLQRVRSCQVVAPADAGSVESGQGIER